MKNKNSKQIKKKILLVSLSLVIISLLLSSCTSSNTTSFAKNYQQGYKGAILTTLDNSPPEIVYPASDFRITVKVDNQGAYKLTNGKVEIVGFDDKYISLEQYKKEITSVLDNLYLQGKSSTNPAGEFGYLEFKGRTKNLFPGSISYTAPFFIEAEYNYRTELGKTVCINPNRYDVYNSGCKVESRISLNGQGSPMTITDLEEIIYPGVIPKVEFRFKLRNQGQGKIKMAEFKYGKLGGKDMKCEFKDNPSKNKRVFEFKDKPEASMVCSQIISSQKSYYTTLFLDFTFTYVLKERKTLRIKK